MQGACPLCPRPRRPLWAVADVPLLAAHSGSPSGCSPRLGAGSSRSEKGLRRPCPRGPAS